MAGALVTSRFEKSALRCSHILCKVRDIHSAVRDLTDLGFCVELGSRPDRAHNALIWFESGPFLEFFELPRAASMLRHPFSLLYGKAAGERLVHWATAPEGWCDVALEIDDTSLGVTRSELASGGFSVSRVIRGRRTRQDGTTVRYEFVATRPSSLPFVVSAYDPPQRPPRIVHPNGARSVSSIRLRVSENERGLVERLLPSDPWLRLVGCTSAGVQSVELAGLIARLDATKLHGAVLLPERKP